ncbi:MAG: hypothetical protein A3A51_01800 [Candidatus Levybacteria bacterium RIFCSPLOWO2_01_FULL_39_10]|nr:MAG: hypothetical protein A3A51_01800 [Candidatus Levybacteria bacterium RIFCSPLOWO2_01_FULL_39_10]
MARVFLDANILIDLTEKRGTITSENLGGHKCSISPLSVHILFYILKKRVPFLELKTILDPFSIIDLTKNIYNEALIGPTFDFEDNVQLHSAAEADCDIFLTNDKNLLKLKFFGKARILSSL